MEIDSVAAGSCSKENQIIYKDWFEFADSDGDGRITGSDAIKFFSMSNLPRPELKQVWAIADAKRQGYLGFKEFIVAMQLVSLAQTGHEISHEVLHSDGMLIENWNQYSFLICLWLIAVDFKNMNPPVMDGLIVLMAVSIWACIFHFMSFKFEYMLLTTVHLTTQKKKKHSPKSSDPNGSPAADASLTAHWFSSKSSKKISLSSVTSIIDGLKRLYIQKLKPLEVAYQFNDFVSPLLTNSDFDAKPMVMLLGQYSTGKTTFIKHMLKSRAHIGPEPTTDRFVVVMSGPDERSIPGNTVAVQADMPFSGLTSFGTAFLSKFECSQMPHPLMRVYGALMWSLGKVLNTPEVARVYIGSFSDKPINEASTGPIGRELFEMEQEDLLSDLKNIPKKACDRRINEFVKRARAAKIHAYIISHLKKEMPAIMGKAKAQQKLMDNLEDVFGKVQREHHLPKGDFPNVDQFREVLSGYNFDKFEKLKPKNVADC
ncbi:hypothetical protein HID58_019047 [Brassica napus]|uniref:EH domain-containing protein 1 n=1 Tax=Brassica napus TaxID=3708 RepID=A0ABQ8DBP4_BRANA|nr:hypothetical protein HID58_019047 [Brassica napus]